MKTKLTDEDRATARFLAKLAERFMTFNPDMAVRSMRAYGLVGFDPGHSVQEYARKAQEAPGTMSRCLLDMGPHNRWGQPGGLLIDSSTTYRNQKEHHLTPAGIELLREIQTLRQTENGK